MTARLLPYEFALAEKFAHAADTKVAIQVHSDVPMNGKRAIVVDAALTTPFGELKILIAEQERLLPRSDIATAPDRIRMHIHEIDRDVSNDESLYSLGYEFAPLLHISGFGHEFSLRVRGSPSKWAVPWWPHATATDLVRHVCTRLKPFDLRYCRMVCDEPAVMKDGVPPAPVDIPIVRSYEYGVGVEVPIDATITDFRSARGVARAAALGRLVDVSIGAGYNMQGIGVDEKKLRSPASAIAAMQPRQLRFLRSQDGVPVTFLVQFVGTENIEEHLTIGRVRDAIIDFCKKAGAPQRKREEAKAEGKVTPSITTPTILVDLVLSAEYLEQAEKVSNGPEYSEVTLADPFEALQNPFDDDDEEIAPRGVKRVYCHDGDLLLRDSAAVKSLTQQLRFMREPDAVRDTLHQARDTVFEAPLTLSFNPPLNQYLAVELPHFIDVAQDLRIPHLSDLGILPGCEVFVEYYDPLRALWSNELSQQWEHTRADRSVAVRSCRGTLHHVPVQAGVTTAADVMDRLFCSTGDLPMFFLLAADGGRLLQSCDVVLGGQGSQALPAPSLYAIHRPRPWLGESLYANLQNAIGSSETGLNPVTNPRL